MLFQAIEEQGRERFLSAFLWTSGTASFFRGVSASRVEFPLDLDLATLMLAGLEVSLPEAVIKDQFRDCRHRVLRRLAPSATFPLPRPVGVLREAVGGSGMALGQVLMRVSVAAKIETAEALRAMQVGIALGVLELA
jgi:hypothetical protein